MFWRSFFSLLSFAVLLCDAAPATNKQTERKINILNESGSRAEIFWIHPHSRERALMSTPDVLHGATFPLNSFIGHEFEVREKASKSTGVCKSEDQTCRSIEFKVSPGDEQTFTLNKDFHIDFVDDHVKAKQQASEIVTTCQESATAKLEAAKSNPAKVQEAMDALVKCVEGGVAQSLSRANEELAFQSTVRKAMAEQMENYTCVDPDMDTSPALESKYWMSTKDRKRRKVDILFDRPASKIHLVHNFISPEECEAMEKAAQPRLHHATVADGKGGSELSENRKAMQAGIKVRWSKEAEGDHIAILSRRVYDYANYVLDLGIEEHGQEDLMSIQYFGRGTNDTAPDRYMPHCDGECTGLPHKSGTRMATMVMYCTVPESGGHTNFRNANVHVKPDTGGATFFSYIDPATLVMDNGFTEHSGCPVFEGEKKIVTQWIRLGVDSANPWNSFNTLGVKHADAQD